MVMLITKKQRNKIHGLIINGSWSTDVKAIMKEVLEFYKAKFQEKWPNRPKMISKKFNALDSSTRISLEAQFSIDEIKKGYLGL